MHPVQQFIKQQLEQYPAEGSYHVAFSGGCDSIVLLHAMHALLPAENLLAVHVNHGLQEESVNWDEFCRLQAEQLGVCYVSVSADLADVHSNIEAEARKERYRIFSQQMSEVDILLTAHHRDDQAETVLLQLMRGSGSAGLGGMSQISHFKPGRLLRPLLEFSRIELEDYARKFQLQWVDDPSNSDNSFDRNFLRNEVIPLLETRWPAAGKNIARSALNCREADELVTSQSQQDLTQCVARYKHSLSIKQLIRFSPARQHHIIRQWIVANDCPLPDRSKVEYICNEFIHFRNDARPILNWHETELHRFKENLYLVRPITHGHFQQQYLSKTDISNGYIELQAPAGRMTFAINETFSAWDATQLSIRFRQRGDEIYLPNRPGSRKIKKLFQQWGIPPWMRQWVPMLFANDNCVAIADFAKCINQHEAPVQVLNWEPSDGYDWR